MLFGTVLLPFRCRNISSPPQEPRRRPTWARLAPCSRWALLRALSRALLWIVPRVPCLGACHVIAVGTVVGIAAICRDHGRSVLRGLPFTVGLAVSVAVERAVRVAVTCRHNCRRGLAATIVPRYAMEK